MLIICPSCTARYHVDAGTDDLQHSVRNLRCGRCGNAWQASPVDPPAEILPPELRFPQQRPVETLATGEPSLSQAQLAEEPAYDAGEGDKPDSADEDVPPAYQAARRSMRPARLTRHRAGPAKAFTLGMLLAVIGAGLHYRHDVVKAVPSSAALYALVGLPVNLHGLDFRNMESRRSFEDGLPVLVVEGEIVNLRDTPSDVPALRIAVRGEAGEPLYSWRVEPRQRTLEANGRMPVRSRLAAPPSGAIDVELRFDPRTTPTPSGLRP